MHSWAFVVLTGRQLTVTEPCWHWGLWWVGWTDGVALRNSALPLTWTRARPASRQQGTHQKHREGTWKDTSADTTSHNNTSRRTKISFLFFLPPTRVKEWVTAHCWYFSLGRFTLEWTSLLRIGKWLQPYSVWQKACYHHEDNNNATSKASDKKLA